MATTKKTAKKATKTVRQAALKKPVKKTTAKKAAAPKKPRAPRKPKAPAETPLVETTQEAVELTADTYANGEQQAYDADFGTHVPYPVAYVGDNQVQWSDGVVTDIFESKAAQGVDKPGWLSRLVGWLKR